MLSVQVSAVDQFRPVQKLLDGIVQVKVSGGSFGQACVLDASASSGRGEGQSDYCSPLLKSLLISEV